jgi:hypothetical protein
LETGGTGRVSPAYSIPTAFMLDETREPETVNVWQNAKDYVDAVKRCYRRDNWQDQPNYCDVWSEKATILGAIRPVADHWGITLRVCHGFGSTGMEEQVGMLFDGITQKITVFFLGDHDPSGHVIEEDIHRRAEIASGKMFRMLGLAIHKEDIAAFNLPPQTIKMTDSRAASFRRQFGADAAYRGTRCAPGRRVAPAGQFRRGRLGGPRSLGTPGSKPEFKHVDPLFSVC